MNDAMDAMRMLQEDMAGEAVRSGICTDEDVLRLLADMRAQACDPTEEQENAQIGALLAMRNLQEGLAGEAERLGL